MRGDPMISTIPYKAWERNVNPKREYTAYNVPVSTATHPLPTTFGISVHRTMEDGQTRGKSCASYLLEVNFMRIGKGDAHPALWASSIAALAGLWLFFSPWIYGVYGDLSAWNCWIVGFLIVAFGVMRMGRPADTRLSWLNCVLGLWVFFSPWIYGYAGDNGRFINSLFVAAVVFCAAIIGANSEWMTHHRTSTSS